MNREEWLLAAADKLRQPLKQVGAVVPEKLAVSVGFNYRNARKTLGVCFSSKASEGTVQVFVSPVLSDEIEVLGVLTHELIHASDDGESKHRGHFAQCARAIGLEGKLTATHPGPELAEMLAEIHKELGDYPHSKLGLTAAGQKKQTTRLLKAVCSDTACPLADESGKVYTIRVTQKWVTVGLPSCPCGSEMRIDV